MYYTYNNEYFVTKDIHWDIWYRSTIPGFSPIPGAVCKDDMFLVYNLKWDKCFWTAGPQYSGSGNKLKMELYCLQTNKHYYCEAKWCCLVIKVQPFSLEKDNCDYINGMGQDVKLIMDGFHPQWFKRPCLLGVIEYSVQATVPETVRPYYVTRHTLATYNYKGERLDEDGDSITEFGGIKQEADLWIVKKD